MKSILVLLFFVLITKHSYTQSFEGTLTYVTDIEVAEKMKKLGVTKESLIAKMKAENTWFDSIKTTYKNGNYYSFANNYKSIYKSDSNKIYTFNNGLNSEVCSVIDASIDAESVLINKQPSISLLDTSAIVLDNICKIVRVKWKTGYYDYYFNSTILPMDSLLFKNHIYDGWNNYLKFSNSLPLKKM